MPKIIKTESYKVVQDWLLTDDVTIEHVNERDEAVRVFERHLNAYLYAGHTVTSYKFDTCQDTIRQATVRLHESDQEVLVYILNKSVTVKRFTTDEMRVVVAAMTNHRSVTRVEILDWIKQTDFTETWDNEEGCYYYDKEAFPE